MEFKPKTWVLAPDMPPTTGITLGNPQDRFLPASSSGKVEKAFFWSILRIQWDTAHGYPAFHLPCLLTQISIRAGKRPPLFLPTAPLPQLKVAYVTRAGPQWTCSHPQAPPGLASLQLKPTHIPEPSGGSVGPSLHPRAGRALPVPFYTMKTSEV